MELNKKPIWPGFKELTPAEQAALLARIHRNQECGDTLGGSRRARDAFGLPGVTAPNRTKPVPGSKAAARAARQSFLD